MKHHIQMAILSRSRTVTSASDLWTVCGGWDTDEAIWANQKRSKRELVQLVVESDQTFVRRPTSPRHQQERERLWVSIALLNGVSRDQRTYLWNWLVWSSWNITRHRPHARNSWTCKKLVLWWRVKVEVVQVHVVAHTTQCRPWSGGSSKIMPLAWGASALEGYLSYLW